MDNKYIIVFSTGIIISIAAGCQLPLSDDVWLSSTRGNWTVTNNGTRVKNFAATLTATLPTADLNCSFKSGPTTYVLDTKVELFFGIVPQLFICLDIRKISEYSYVYYIVTDVDITSGEPFTINSTSVCSSTGYETPTNAHVLLRKGYETRASTNFPNIILGNYSVTYVERDGNIVENSTLDTCIDTTLMNYTNNNASVKLAFTSDNQLLCVHTVASGSFIYVQTYSNDSSESKTTFTFACWVLAYTSTGVAATVHPEKCMDSQTSTSVMYPGQKFTFTPYVTCPILVPSAPTPEGLKSWLIPSIVLSILFFIILLIILPLYIRQRLIGRRKLEDEEGIIKGKIHAHKEYSIDIGRKEKVYDSGFNEMENVRRKNRGQTFDVLKIHKGDKSTNHDNRFNEMENMRRKNQEQTFDLLEIHKGDKSAREPTFDLFEITKGGDEREVTLNLLEITKDKVHQSLQEKNTRSELEFPAGKREISITTIRRLEENDITLMKTKTEREKTKREHEEKEKKEKRDQGVHGRNGKNEQRVIAEKLDQIIKPVKPISSNGEYHDTISERPHSSKDEYVKISPVRTTTSNEESKKISPVRTTTSNEESKTVKSARQTSSNEEESETDEKEKEERMQKLLRKKKRLEDAAYQPPQGIKDVTVVGRKKRRQLSEGEDGIEKDKNLMTRDQQEKLDSQRKHRKKALKRIAKHKFHTTSDAETSESEVESKHRRLNKRKGQERSAPYIQQYHTKKHIEKELDEIDYWTDKETKVEPFVDAFDQDDKVKKTTIQAEPVESEKQPEESEKQPEESEKQPEESEKQSEELSPAKMTAILKEEEDGWEALGIPGFKLGPNSELPDGYHFDEEGNVVRDIDGKVIPNNAFKKQLEFRWKYGYIFELPRLKRNTDGRPTGGYKDDPFGPTAEWNYGDYMNDNECEKEQKHAEHQKTSSGKHVEFITIEEASAPPTPINELIYNETKGRQIGSAQRELLNTRLFDDKPKSELNQAPSSLPYGDVNLQSAEIQSQELSKIERNTSQKAAPGSFNTIEPSDTFDDGCADNIRRNTRLHSSWTEIIPDNAIQDSLRALQVMSKSERHIGSDDEFVLVGGSSKTLHKSQKRMEPLNLCPRYERMSKKSSGEQLEQRGMSMRIATDLSRPFSNNDRRLKNPLEEFYQDKKYFGRNLKIEALPTNATLETREMASNGLDFLNKRANYRHNHEPVSSGANPPDPALGRTRMHSYADSQMSFVRSSVAERSFRAGNAQSTARQEQRENALAHLTEKRVATSDKKSKLDSSKVNRDPPTGRSEEVKIPTEFEVKSEETVTIDRELNDQVKTHKKQYNVKSPLPNQSTGNRKDTHYLPGNVLTITDN